MNRLRGWMHRCVRAAHTQSMFARVIGAASLTFIILAALAVARADAATYTITDLGTLGGVSSNASAINNLGQVVGNSDIAGGGYHACLWDSAGLHDLGTLGFPASVATSINDLGQVVGYSNITGNSAIHPFLWDSTGLHDLAALSGTQAYIADGINNAGQIVGTLTVNDPTSLSRYHPFLFSNGVMRDIGVPSDLSYPPDGNNYIGAAGINASGQVIVYANRETSDNHRFFLWQNGAWRNLKPLDDRASFVAAINDAGQVIGALELPGDNIRHAFVYDGIAIHDLGTFGGPRSYAYGINNVGQVVGYAEMDGPPPAHPRIFNNGVMEHPFLYSGGAMYDLTDLLLTSAPWEQFVPFGINDRGQIVGTGKWDAGASGVRSSAFLLTPTPAPFLRVSAGSLTFGSQPAGATSAAQSITLKNAGQLPLTISSVSLIGANAAIFAIASDSGEASLSPGASRTIAITFTPTVGGSDSASLEISHSDLRPTSQHTVALSGTGTVPAISLSAGSISFGNQLVGSTSSEQTVSLSNTGQAPLAIQKIDVQGDNAGEFAATELSGLTLTPGESRTIRVRFTPASRGSRTAALVLASNASGSPTRLSLTGAGIAPVVNISPGSLNFGSQRVGVGNDAQAVTLQNTGDAPLDVQRAAITGEDAGDFTIATDGWTGAHLLPGQIATLNMRFTPTAVGSRSARLVVTDTATWGSQSISLTGTGTAPAASLTAGSLTFGDQPTGTTSAEQTVTLTNTGTATLTLLTVTLAGANPGDFSAATDPGAASLAPGQSGTIRVRFHPTAAGPRSATLVLADSAAGSPHTVTLSGRGTAPWVSFGISRLAGPGSSSFGAVTLGTSSSTQTLTLTNSGNAPLTFGSLALAGTDAGDYRLIADSGGATLAPGATRTITLRFTPMALGDRGASLLISDNAAGSPQSVGLSGAGVLPTASSRGRALIPISAELLIAAIDGVSSPVPATSPGKPVTVAPGQHVSLTLRVRFPNGAVADVSPDRNCQFSASRPVGKFTSKSVWSAGVRDVGRTVTLTGRYTSPLGGKRLQSSVTLTVRAARPMRP